MKIAIPLALGRLCVHFGHCEEFAVVEADEKEKKIVKTEILTPPPHEPGVIPRWIASLGVNLVIAGGMGPMAQRLLAAQGITALAGAPPLTPEQLVTAWFAGTLEPGDNVCSHDGNTGTHTGAGWGADTSGGAGSGKAKPGAGFLPGAGRGPGPERGRGCGSGLGLGLRNGPNGGNRCGHGGGHRGPGGK